MEGELRIPKQFVTGIRVPYGPLAGELAQPCVCGGPTLLGEEPLYLVQVNDELRFCHVDCVPPMPDA